MTVLRPEGFAGRGPANRKDLIARMAADLCRAGIPTDETDAIRALCRLDYRFGDVTALAEDALFAARESAVAASMATETPQSPSPAKASQAPLPETVLAAPGSKDSGFLSTSLSLLTLEAPLAWRNPETGA
ncbi:hypothetical protein J4G43_030365 [Bradyrhizobium barranii subsp. barranii]|uniref:Uncharacterized protein n=1 Tax=Bradyrhizobium barranii subsp. barranii TaxID=2823807 RepID=A0A939M902_9BRAD|nr:hypothetical protein [Bradyrhizobium barranii]UEM09045.1 hypothetical protein J4G43_030365 [Bradyrhizobium barranii subsp. barranii]